MVKKIFQRSIRNGSNLLFSKQQTIISGAIVIAVMLLASAILGMVKKRLYAGTIPLDEYSLFVSAFKLPDLAFQLLIGGALNAAFVPVFAQMIQKSKQADTWQFLSWVLNAVTIIFIVISALLYVFADKLTILVGAGFTGQDKVVLVELMRILLLAPLLLGISSFIAGTLQSYKRFFMPFLSPLIYNFGAIFGIIVLYPMFGIKGAAWGVVIGAVGHLVVQLPALLYLGFTYSFKLNFTDKNFQRIAKLAVPRTIGAGIEHIKLMFLISFASLIPGAGVTYLDLGQSVANLPISIIGVSIAQASLPEFAALLANNNLKTLRHTFMSAFNQILYFVMPASVVLIVLKIPVVRLLFGAGQFGWLDTVMTAWVVSALGVGVAVQAVNALIVRMFYALQETKLPVVLGTLGMIVSLAMAGIAIAYFPEKAIVLIALSISVGSMIEFVLLFIALIRRGIIDFYSFIVTPIKIVLASLVTAVVMYLPVRVLDVEYIDTTRVLGLVVLVWLVLFSGGVTYLFTTWLLGVRELNVVISVFLKIKSMRDSLQKAFRSPHIINSTLLDDPHD
jgi:putative peptidoglycan lipid II flippase